MTEHTSINWKRAEEIGIKALVRAGVPEENARIQVDLLLEAELRGRASHGLLRLPRVIERIRNGVANPVATGRMEWRGDALLHVDGEQGLGPVVGFSALGQIDLQKKLNPAAVDSLTKAAPLLKSNAAVYARNQYRLGFAYLNLKNTAGAKQAFTDAASVDSPYKGPAQDKLKAMAATKAPAKKGS